MKKKSKKLHAAKHTEAVAPDRHAGSRTKTAKKNAAGHAEAVAPDSCAGTRKTRSKIIPQERLEVMAEMFRSLADPSRLKIVNAMLAGEMCVNHLAEATGFSQPSISHHLSLLRRMRLARCRREGKNAYYSLNDYHVGLLFDLCRSHAEEIDGEQ